MNNDPQTIEECLQRLLAGTESPADREQIAIYIRSVEERTECWLEIAFTSRDKWLTKAAGYGDEEAREWLADREADRLADIRDKQGDNDIPF